MYTDVSIYKYTYVHAYAHMHANTHKSLHTQSLTHPPPPHSYTSHTLSMSLQPHKDTHSYKCTHPLPHTCHKHVCPLQEQKLASTCTFSHAFTHSHTASRANTLFHIQLPTQTTLHTHHLRPTCALSHTCFHKCIHAHPAATHAHTCSLTPMPHRCTHKYTISHHPYAFTPHSHIPPALSLSHTETPLHSYLHRHTSLHTL